MKQLQANQTISTPMSASANELVVNHLQVAEISARAYAHKYAYLHISKDDFYSAACLGLCVAARLYKPNMGASFTTYAYYWVNKYLEEERIYNSKYSTTYTFIDPVYDEDEDYSEYALQVADPYNMEEHACASSARKHLLRTLKHVLTAREYEVITRFYGFVGNGEAEDERTIAKSLGASRQAINLSKNNALQKMERELPVSFWNELLGK